MLYYSGEMVHDGCNYFPFGAIFYHFTPLIAWKIKIKKKFFKKNPEISSFYTSVSKMVIICYTVPEIWHTSDVIVIFHFGLFFAIPPPHPPKQPKKSKIFKKIKKMAGDNIILHMCTKNYDQMMYGYWDMVHNGWTNRQTDESDI